MYCQQTSHKTQTNNKLLILTNLICVIRYKTLVSSFQKTVAMYPTQIQIGQNIILFAVFYSLSFFFSKHKHAHLCQGSAASSFWFSGRHCSSSFVVRTLIAAPTLLQFCRKAPPTVFLLQTLGVVKMAAADNANTHGYMLALVNRSCFFIGCSVTVNKNLTSSHLQRDRLWPVEKMSHVPCQCLA